MSETAEAVVGGGGVMECSISVQSGAARHDRYLVVGIGRDQ